MARTAKNSPPSYRLHRGTGQAVCTVGGKEIYLGKHGSPESLQRYANLIAERAGGAVVTASSTEPAGITVSRLIIGYLKSEQARFAGATADNRKKTLGATEAAMRVLKELFGATPAAAFKLRHLKLCREAFVAAGNNRKTTNDRVRRIKCAFRWAAEDELIPGNVSADLAILRGLKAGQTTAEESTPVAPVPAAWIDAMLPHTSRQVGAMVRLQMLCGARPGEIAAMRWADIDVSGPLWVYSPGQHKGASRGHVRRIYLGPQAQAILNTFRRPALEQFIFSPCEAVAEQGIKRRAARVTPLTPSQRARTRKARPAKAPRDHYDTNSFRRAIWYACDAANRVAIAALTRPAEDGERLIPRFNPHALRHSFATNIAREHGSEKARVLLGHRHIATSEIYIEHDHAKAASVLLKQG